METKINNSGYAFFGELSYLPLGKIPEEYLKGKRVLEDNKGGHTSVSLFFTDEKADRRHHVLVDAGIGTFFGLSIDASTPRKVDAILLTHGDYDHIAELPLIGEVLKRLHRHELISKEQPIPIPVWSIAEVRDVLQARTFPYVAWTPVRNPSGPLQFLSFELEREITLKQGQTAPVYKTFHPVTGCKDLTVTPVGGVLHRDGVIFAVNYRKKEGEKKIILAWDMEKLPWDPNPNTAGEINDEFREILETPDLIIVESNTYEKRKTGHICARDALRFIKAICRKDTQCFVIHYSGFEDFFTTNADPAPIYDNMELEKALNRDAEKMGIKLDLPIRVARSGDKYSV